MGTTVSDKRGGSLLEVVGAGASAEEENESLLPSNANALFCFNSPVTGAAEPGGASAATPASASDASPVAAAAAGAAGASSTTSAFAQPSASVSRRGMSSAHTVKAGGFSDADGAATGSPPAMLSDIPDCDQEEEEGAKGEPKDASSRPTPATAKKSSAAAAAAAAEPAVKTFPAAAPHGGVDGGEGGVFGPRLTRRTPTKGGM